MEATLNSAIIVPKFHWFDRFLAVLCVLFSLLLMVGLGISTSAVVRNVDASLGLLKREASYYIKNIGKITKLTNAINANAQFAVAIVGDITAVLRDAAILAFKFVLQTIVSFLLSSLRNVMNGLLSSINTWISALSGLLDSVKSFLSALAVKVFANQECAGKRTADVVGELFGLSFSKANSGLTTSCSAGSAGGAENTNYTGGDLSTDEFTNFSLTNTNITSTDFQYVMNSVSSLRMDNLISYSSKGVIPGNQIGENSSDKGTGTKSTSVLTTQAELETKKQDIANSIAIMQCTKNNTDSTSIYNIESVSAYNSDCYFTAANTFNELDKVIASDITLYDSAVTNTVTASPSDCKFNGFITDTAKTDTSFRVAPFSDTASFTSFANSVVNTANTFDTKVLTPNQCNSANTLSTVQNSAATQVAANNKPSSVESAAEGALQSVLNSAINDLIDGIQKVLDNFIQSVFQLVINLVQKFLSSLPGGEFLSQTLTSTLTATAVNTQNEITKVLNNLRTAE